MDVKRRNFIRQLCFTCGSVAILPACVRNYSVWRFLKEHEANLLRAIAEQIIPADKDPGAADANVVNFFDKQLTGYYVRHQEIYRNGLQYLETSCRSIYEKSFSDLDWDTQTRFLEDMESGKLPPENWKDINQKSFFNMLLDHTMQGFYGSPRHGGNCNYVSYKMLKIDYPHVIGQNRYDLERSNRNPKSI